MSLPAAPTLDTAVQAMINVLHTYLPAPGGAVPDPSVSVTSLTERTVGLGNFRGAGTSGPFPDLITKGIRLDAVTRFQLWASDPVAADAAVTSLASQLASTTTALWTQGFLKMTLESAPPPEVIPSLPAWRKYADYRVLYEYAYTDTGGADSLIAKIPIDLDGAFGETTTVTDAMVRWDAAAAPPLVVRGPITVNALGVLLWVSSPPLTRSVTITRTFDGALGAPAAKPDLPSFLAAVAGTAPPERHASVTFATPNQLLPPPPVPDLGSIFMGDVDNDGIPDEYHPSRVELAPGIALPEPEDRLEVAYQSPLLEKTAVMYLRALRG